jgi:drug/metabolite transporter (DMT)-like permease
MSRRNWTLFALVGILWGIPYLLMKVAVREFPPTVVVFARVFVGFLLLIPLALSRKTLRHALGYWRRIGIYAIAEMVLPWILITTAERRLSSGLAGLLVATVPIFATILASLNGDRTVWQRKRVFGIVIGFFGLILVVGIESLSGHQDLISIAMIICASALYAWAVNMINIKIPHVDAIAMNGLAMLITAVIYLPLAIGQWPTKAPDAKGYLAILSLGLFPTALAFVLYFMLMKEIGQARGSLVTYLNTAVAVLLGVLLLREPLTLGIIVGLPLVLIGSYFASRQHERVIG